MAQEFFRAFKTSAVTSTGAAVYDVVLDDIMSKPAAGYFEVDESVYRDLAGDDTIGDELHSFADFVILNAAGKIDIDRAAAAARNDEVAEWDGSDSDYED